MGFEGHAISREGMFPLLKLEVAKMLRNKKLLDSGLGAIKNTDKGVSPMRQSLLILNTVRHNIFTYQ